MYRLKDGTPVDTCRRSSVFIVLYGHVMVTDLASARLAIIVPIMIHRVRRGRRLGVTQQLATTSLRPMRPAV